MAIIIKGDGDDTVKQRGNSDDTIILGFGSDSAFGAKGSDVIVGEVLDFEIVDDVVFDSDKTLDGEGGNDIIYGDAINAFIDTRFEDNIFASKTIIFGSETNLTGGEGIVGGAGDDILYGDLHTFSITAEGRDAVIVDSETFTSVNAIVRPHIFVFGNDTLDGGSNNDTLYGDLHTFNLTAIGGNLVGGPANAAGLIGQHIDFGNSFTLGDDTLDGGGGKDTLYGDLHTMSLNAQGGTAVDTEGNWSNTNAGVIENLFTFGSDILLGKGGVDTLYGDAHTLSLTALGGSADGSRANGNAAIGFQTYIFGNDTLEGGRGDDILYGDLHTFSIVQMEGTVINGGEAIAKVILNDFIFGDDLINGGNDADELHGDLVVFSLAESIISVEVTADNHIEITDASVFSTSPFPNTITWGNDQLTGGKGDDTFVFTLIEDINGNMIMQGNDVILDFKFNDDILEFRDVIDADQSGVVDINDLVAVTDLSFVDVDNDGVGDVNIQFVDVATGMDEMGSIVLKDVADPLSAQPSILDLVDVITVVEA